MTTQLLRDALASAQSGDKSRSHRLFGLITKTDPNNEAAWLWYANTADDPTEAVVGLRNALRLNPKNSTAAEALPVALFRSGVAAAKTKNREQAARYLAEATALNPRDELAWLWLAGVSDEPTRTLEYLERVLQLNPNNAQAKAGAERLRAQLAPPWSCPICKHRPDCANDTIAETCLQCGVITNLDHIERFDKPTPHLNQALVVAAARSLKTAWATGPKTEVTFALGLALLNLGNTDDGIRAIQAASRASDADPEWRNQVARFVERRQKCANKGAPVAPASDTRATVMIVDDSVTVRTMVAAVLSKAGYHVTAADGAAEAARLIQAGSIPHLFLLDVNMPDTDGFALCKVLRSHSQTANVPVVFLTGKTGLLNKIRGRWIGAAEYITKPFQSEMLLATVARLTRISST